MKKSDARHVPVEHFITDKALTHVNGKRVVGQKSVQISPHDAQTYVAAGALSTVDPAKAEAKAEPEPKPPADTKPGRAADRKQAE
jgi:hypothetical protein